MRGNDGTVLRVVLAAREQGGPHGVGAPADDGVVAVGEQGQVEWGGIRVDNLFSAFVKILAGSNEKLDWKIKKILTFRIPYILAYKSTHV